MQKRSMASAKNVIRFWVDALVNDYGKYWMDAWYDDTDLPTSKRGKDICFACGTNDVYTQRAHIVPHRNGGSGEPENLHMLCMECHRESEFIETTEAYFSWFAHKSPHNSGSLALLQSKALFYEKCILQNEIHLLPDYIKPLLGNLLLAAQGFDSSKLNQESYNTAQTRIQDTATRCSDPVPAQEETDNEGQLKLWI